MYCCIPQDGSCGIGWKFSGSARHIASFRNCPTSDCQLDYIGYIDRGMECSHFEVVNVKSLRRHHALNAQALEFVNEAALDSCACTWPPARPISNPSTSASTRS
jgi:hypothetical protein